MFCFQGCLSNQVCFLWLDLPGPGSDGFSPTTPRGLTRGLLIMLCWPRGAPGCAREEGFAMPDAVCKSIKLAASFFMMQKQKWLSNTQQIMPFLHSFFCLRCDRGFGGAYCVPIVPLPSILKDDFNGNLHPDLWPEVYGAERGNLNGETIKSGTSLIFKGVR